MMLSNVSLVAFHYKSYGTFCVYSKSPIIPQWSYPLQKLYSLRIFANEFNYNGYKDELRFILDSKIPKMYNCSILVIQLYNKENEEENV